MEDADFDDTDESSAGELGSMWVGINVAPETNQPTFWRASFDIAVTNGITEFPFAKSIRDSTIELHKQKGSEALPITWGPLPPDVTGQRWALGKMGKSQHIKVPSALIGVMRSNYWLDATTNMYLHELPSPLLVTILRLLTDMDSVATQFQRNSDIEIAAKQLTKIRRAQHAATSVLACRDSVTASFLRRTDYVPMSYFKKYDIDDLMKQLLPNSAVDWLLTKVDLPGASMWPTLPQERLSFWHLFALFMRNFKEETWTHLMHGTVDVRLQLRLAAWDSVWIDQKQSSVSLAVLKRLKGCLLWTIDARTLKEFCKDFDTELKNASGNLALDGNEKWTRSFTTGVLHQITSTDVTSSKMKLSPPMYTNRNKTVAWYMEMTDNYFANSYWPTKPDATPATASNVENTPGSRAGNDMDSWYN